MTDTAPPAEFSPEWLALREPADAAARATELLDPLRTHLNAASGGRLVIHDLGCGTGSMGRWLAEHLAGPKHWVLHDRDPRLLAAAAARLAGPETSTETRLGDITELSADHLAGAALVTASALLDLLTEDEVDRLAEACTQAGCPALLTLSVVGRVELSPADPLDEEIANAFNAHQRRVVGGRRLLGPDAVVTAIEAFERHGALVHGAPSPWRLNSEHSELLGEWLRGWVGAARQQRPELGEAMADYLRRREADRAAGTLRAVVHHQDLLAFPSSGAR